MLASCKLTYDTGVMEESRDDTNACPRRSTHKSLSPTPFVPLPTRIPSECWTSGRDLMQPYLIVLPRLRFPSSSVCPGLCQRIPYLLETVKSVSCGHLEREMLPRIVMLENHRSSPNTSCDQLHCFG